MTLGKPDWCAKHFVLDLLKFHYLFLFRSTSFYSFIMFTWTSKFPSIDFKDLHDDINFHLKLCSQLNHEFAFHSK